MTRKGRDSRRRGGRGQRDTVTNSGLDTSLVASTHSFSSNKKQNNGSSKPTFSLSEEARNTERYRVWNSDLKLRHSHIAFVSAGKSNAQELLHVLQRKSSDIIEHSQQKFAAANSELPQSARYDAPELSLSNMSLNDMYSGNVDVEKIASKTKDRPVEESLPDQATNSEGRAKNSHRPSHVKNTNLPRPEAGRRVSFDPSDSSDEVILFAGRQISQSQTPGKQCTTEHSKISSHEGSLDVLENAHTTKKSSSTIINPLVKSDASHGQYAQHRPTCLETNVLTNPSWKETLSKLTHRKRRKRLRKFVEDQDVLRDYITNSCDFDVLEKCAEFSELNRRDLGDPDADHWVDFEESLAAELGKTIIDRSVDGGGCAQSHDLDKLSTSSEASDTLVHVLSKRERPSGRHYDVVKEGFAIEEARWLPEGSPTARGVDRKIHPIEQDQAKTMADAATGDHSDTSSMMNLQETLDVQKDFDDLKAKNELDDRKERMTDRQLANLLWKQEELGFRSNDLLLFNGDGIDSAENKINDAQVRKPLSPTAPLKLQLRSGRKNHYQHSASGTPNTLDEDPYNGFNVMDRDRPSLCKRQKDRRRIASPELSDSDLEQRIKRTWENDRIKKKFRKEKREELRAQGLLGRKGKVNMKARYSEGMSMNQVKDEVRDFLLSPMESLSFPPMAQKERKAVHEIAHVFNLKSKSTGSGKSRYPVLYKTARTTLFDPSALDTINVTLASKRFLPRLDRSKKGDTFMGKAHGRSANPGISYKDGEVVGATAPELGQENKGRAMLEKMGWSTGKALGASNNTRGIVHPVAQVVKTGKAGLG